jgi:hypothetical protein
MLEDEIRALAQKVVDLTKSTAHVDTGALRRSISYTYVRNVVIFRQLFYGVYGNNAKLENNAKMIMPYNVQWEIINTDTNGSVVEIDNTYGTVVKKLLKSGVVKQTTARIRKAIARKIAKETLDRF